MYRFATFKLTTTDTGGPTIRCSLLSFRFLGFLGVWDSSRAANCFGTWAPRALLSWPVFLPLLSVGVELIDRVPSSLGTVCGSGFVLGFFSAVHLGWIWWSLRGLGCRGVAGGGSWPLRDRGFGGRGWVQWCGTPCKSGSIFVNSISLLYQMSKKCLQFSNAKQSIILTYNFINYNCPKGDPIFTQ